MEAKLKIAFKNIYDKKLSKEKYLNNPVGAAQKALAKVKQMREARMFNITLYKYKGDIKGIKVVAKNPNTPNIKPKDVKEEIKEEEMKKEETTAAPPPQQEEIKEEPKKENEEEEKASSEPEEDDKPPEMSKEFFMEFMKHLMENPEAMKEPPDEEEIEDIPEEEIPEPEPEPPKLSGRRRRQNSVLEIEEPKKVPRQVRPIPPRTPRPVKQKYLNPTPEPINEEISKPKRDYKNNKADRIKAIHKLMYND